MGVVVGWSKWLLFMLHYGPKISAGAA